VAGLQARILDEQARDRVVGDLEHDPPDGRTAERHAFRPTGRFGSRL
jgi:hypothetical protein